MSPSNRDGSHGEEDGSDAPLFHDPPSLAASAARGVCWVLVGHPFDLVKVRFQIANRAIRRSAVDVFKRSLLRERGIRVSQSS